MAILAEPPDVLADRSILGHTGAMPEQMTIEAPLAGLYPATVRTFFSASLPDNTKLLAEEIGITTGMVEKRLAEFTHGRYCARSAMKLLGTRPAPIGKGPGQGACLAWWNNRQY